ncbi:hypothetical protein AVEN_90393-1 [Araneus ventricosus]|uniref:Uncharacterized protein n=1 Tax=Araneus ventricosus TaxID=182803 RepID=A0A4Y2GK14_ARAVE|nr:hypothetical protein AVEN_90393-1 [Araneus ventricosus]
MTIQKQLVFLAKQTFGRPKDQDDPLPSIQQWHCRAFSSIFKAKPRMSRIHKMDQINSSGFAQTRNGIKGGSKTKSVHASTLRDLRTCVFDAVKKPLQALYDNPYWVLGRTDKTFTIEKNGKVSTINIDYVKPEFFKNSLPVAVPSSMQSVPEPSPSSPVSPPNSFSTTLCDKIWPSGTL